MCTKAGTGNMSIGTVTGMLRLRDHKDSKMRTQVVMKTFEGHGEHT